MPWPPLPAKLVTQCAVAFHATPNHRSQLQRPVADALRALGLDPREEVRTAQGYSLDAVVCVRGVQVAVEVDGPSHFVGRTQKLTGATALKRRQLHAFGWPLLAVPYWEWERLRGRGEQLEYLQRQLHEAVRDMAPKDI